MSVRMVRERTEAEQQLLARLTDMEAEFSRVRSRLRLGEELD